MGLNKKGIDKLEKIMLANKKYYEQSHFARKTDCGTVMCAAGFCRLMEIGKKKFNAEVRAATFWNMDRFGGACEQSGARLLGITAEISYFTECLELFDKPSTWPDDLRAGFEACKTPLRRVRFYIKMLRTRVNDDGSIRAK
jgi:hypothetical protein